MIDFLRAPTGLSVRASDSGAVIARDVAIG